MSNRTSITVLRPRQELEGLWQQERDRLPSLHAAGVSVDFRAAPGDRGTEIHVAVDDSSSEGGLQGAVAKLRRSGSLAQVKDELRHFKQIVETREISRSDGVPEGERVGRKLHQRPAQPLRRDELQKAGA